MKITDLKLHRVEWDIGASFNWRDGIRPRGPKGSVTLLRVITDEDVEGVSPVGPGGLDLEEAKWHLVGQDPLDRERIWQDLWRSLRSSKIGLAIGPVDCALWDLFGKLTGLPVYKALGGMRDRIPAYASTYTLDTIDDYLELARRCIEQGYTGIKLHAWGRLEQDAELCRQLRKTVGDDIVLMYDASSMFNAYEDALWFGRRLEECGFFWYEEPMDHFNVTALARLADELDIPLAVAEASHGGPFDALAHIRAGAADMIITGPLDAYKGGMTGVMKTAHICEGYSMLCAIHSGNIASLHAACAIPNTRFFERLDPFHERSAPGIVDASTDIDRNGMAGPWDKPGLGLEIDWDWVKRHTVAEE